MCPTAHDAGFQKEPCDGWDKITDPCGRNETICHDTTAACKGGIWCAQGKYPPCSGANCTCAEIPGCKAANAGAADAVAVRALPSWKPEPSMPGGRVGCGMAQAGTKLAQEPGARPKRAKRGGAREQVSFDLILNVNVFK